MSTSTLKFYKNTPILPNKNFMVDHLSDYLLWYYEKLASTNHEYFSISDFQYIKHSLNLDIKIDSDQTNLEFLLDSGWNYMSIQNSDSTRIVYYFIVNKEWRAQGTIKLTLYLDTLNTFSYGTDYILSDKTKVMREHKDRFRRYYKRTEVEWGGNELYNTTKENIEITNSRNSSNGTIFHVFISNPPFWTEVEDFTKENWRLDFNPNPSTYTSDVNVSLELIDYTISELGIELIIFYSGLSAGNSVVDFYLQLYYSYVDKEPYFIRNIDYFNEGLNPILYKKEETEILQDDNINVSWNLLYKGTTSVECYAIPENPVKSKVITSTDATTTSYSSISEGQYWLFMYGYNTGEYFGSEFDVILPPASSVIIEADGQQYIPYGNTTFAWVEQRFGYAFKRPSGQNYLELYEIAWEKSRFDGSWKKTETLITSNLPSFKLIRPLAKTNIRITSSIPTSYTDANNFLTYTPVTTAVKMLYSIKEIDRTDSKLIKIIKSPYCPAKFTYDDTNGFQMDHSLWNYDSTYNAFKLVSNESELSVVVYSNADSIYSDLFIPEMYFKEYSNWPDLESEASRILPIQRNNSRNIYVESKLFHSSFYQKKFVYDSFSFSFEEEKMSPEESFQTYSGLFDNRIGANYHGLKSYIPDNKMIFEFSITRTINSKFLFSFPDYKLKMSEQDYDHVLPVARNNEEVIYNSDYITYLRTAYNYDLKAKERTEKLAGLQFGLQTGVGAISSLATTIINSPAGVVSWVGTFASTLTGLTQLVNTIAQAEDSVERKLSQLKAQAISVASSDDVDLMVQYSNNRAKLCTYQASDRVREMLWDLFHFTGYATGEMKVPNLTTRINFNFVQADIVIKENKANIPQSLLDNIAERFLGGLTNIHANSIGNNPPYYEFDFAEQYENWEVSLYNDIHS